MEKPSPDPTKAAKDGRGVLRRGSPNLWLLLGLLVIIVIMFLSQQGPPRSTIPYYFFVKQVQEGNIQRVEVGDQEAEGVFKQQPLAPATVDASAKRRMARRKSS